MYTVGIDETGEFNAFSDAAESESFVGAVVSTASTRSLKAAYQTVYDEILARHVPNQRKGLPLLAHFHHGDWFTSGDRPALFPRRVAGEAQRRLAELVRDHIVAVVVSTGRPALVSNRQHWWLVALQSVLEGLFASGVLTEKETVDISIDPRAPKVTGEEAISQRDYHRALERRLAPVVAAHGEEYPQVRLRFHEDTSNIYVNLADMVIGMYRHEPRLLGDEVRIVPCPCLMLRGGDSVRELLDGGDAAGAIRRALEQCVYDRKAVSATLANRCFKALRKGPRGVHQQCWDDILSFVETLLHSRSYDSDLVMRAGEVTAMIEPRLETAWPDESLRHRVTLELRRKQLTHATHVGSIDREVAGRYFDLFAEHGGYLTRRLQRWEAYVQAKVAAAQLYFNAYDFAPVIDDMEQVWSCHERTEMDFPGGAGIDETTAEIAGTLGQAHAFMGNWDDAEEHFLLDEANTVDDTGNLSRRMVLSFLLCLYWRREDRDGVDRQLRLLTPDGSGIDATAKSPSKVRALDNWTLCDFLRGLALSVRQGREYTTRFSWDDLERRNSGYPYPLALKWAGYLAHCWGENDTAVSLLTRSAELLAGQGRFTIRTLAIPAYQMKAVIAGDTRRAETRRYAQWVNDLREQCPSFAAYVDEHVPWAGSLHLEEQNIWQVARALPFYYA